MKKFGFIFTMLLAAFSSSFAQVELLDIESGYYQITCKSTGKCLEVSGSEIKEKGKTTGPNDNGQRVQQWDCTRGADQQLWYLESTGIKGMYYLKCKRSGKCLDITDGKDANGTPIQQWEYAGTPAQKWELYGIQDGDGYKAYIVSVLHGQKCLDVKGEERTKNGGTVQLYDYVRGSDNQIWYLEPVGR